MVDDWTLNIISFGDTLHVFTLMHYTINTLYCVFRDITYFMCISGNKAEKTEIKLKIQLVEDSALEKKKTKITKAEVQSIKDLTG